MRDIAVLLGVAMLLAASAAAQAPAGEVAAPAAPGEVAAPATVAAQPAARAPGSASRAQGTFVALSDLHFDPFFDSSLVAALARAETTRWQGIFDSSAVQSVSAYGKDSNYPLLKSALSAAAKFAPEPDFVLISGDFLGHNFPKLFAQYLPGSSHAAYERFLQKTLKFVTAMIRGTYPRARVISALGNNDTDCGDYEMGAPSRFLAGLERLWQPLLGAAAGSFRRTFPAGGYFSLPHPTVPHLRVAVLNTVLFSPKFQVCGGGRDMSEPQLRWLDSVLRRAARNGDKVWLVYHIPPGIDAYATLQATGPCGSAPVPLWQADDQSRFWSILARHPGVVKATFAGHTHMDEFRLPAGAGFIHVTPAVSPVFGNNPGFAVFDYSRADGRIADARTYYLDLAANAGAPAPWALEYDFQEAYAQPAIDESTLAAVQLAIAGDTKVRDRYMTSYPVSSASSSAVLAHWKAYWCAAQAFTAQTFADCYCPAEPAH
jgi:sphingomyelin phosphodiesterase acid-like 3